MAWGKLWREKKLVSNALSTSIHTLEYGSNIVFHECISCDFV